MKRGAVELAKVARFSRKFQGYLEIASSSAAKERRWLYGYVIFDIQIWM